MNFIEVSSSPLLDGLRMLGTGITWCSSCPSRTVRTPISMVTPSLSPVAALVLPSPGRLDALYGRPFHEESPYSRVLRLYLKCLGIHPDACLVTTAAKCAPLYSRDPVSLLQSVASCSPSLASDLKDFGGKVIIVLGKSAARSVLGLEPASDLGDCVYRLTAPAMFSKPMLVVSVLHPSYLVRVPDNESVLYSNLSKLGDFLNGYQS